jgi:hypothetical protein
MGEAALAVTCRIRELQESSSAIHVHVLISGGADLRLADVYGVQMYWRSVGKNLDAVLSITGRLGIRCAIEQAIHDWHKFPLSISCDPTLSAEVRCVLPQGVLLVFDENGTAAPPPSSLWKRTLNLFSRGSKSGELQEDTDLGLD